MAIYVSFVTAPYAAPGTEMAMLLLYNGLVPEKFISCRLRMNFVKVLILAAVGGYQYQRKSLLLS
jgi:hypothetical protein